MNQQPFYNAIATSGFKVLEFNDHPAFFGSWYSIVQKGTYLFRLVYEGRDTTLMLQKQNQENGWNNIESQEIRALTEEQEIVLCNEWLIKHGAT